MDSLDKCDVCGKEAELNEIGIEDGFSYPLFVCKGCTDKYFKAKKKDAVKQFKQFIEGGD